MHLSLATEQTFLTSLIADQRAKLLIAFVNKVVVLRCDTELTNL